jgi:hypothetical protein
MATQSPRFDPQLFFFLVKFYAIELAATIIFLTWLARAVWHELRWWRRSLPPSVRKSVRGPIRKPR